MDKEKIKYCKCGCGGIPKPGNDYINGHNRRGVILSGVTKENMSVAQQKRFEDPLEREKLSVAKMGNKNRLGHKHSDATKEKMSIAKMGNKNARGHKHSNIAKENMSVAQMGREVSDATKENMSESKKNIMKIQKTEFYYHVAN